MKLAERPQLFETTVCAVKVEKGERASRAVLKYTQDSRATAGQAYSCEVILALSHFHSLPIRPSFCKRKISLNFPPLSFSFKSFLSCLSLKPSYASHKSPPLVFSPLPFSTALSFVLSHY